MMRANIVLLLCLCHSLGFGFSANDGAKTATTDGSQADTQSAIDYVDAKNEDGWVITVGSAGVTYVWTTNINVAITNTVTVQGASASNRPWIVGSNFTSVVTIKSDSQKTATLKDFVFTTAGNPAVGSAVLRIDGGGERVFELNNLLFTNVYVTNWCGFIGSINSYTNEGPFGLVTNCWIIAPTTSVPGFFTRQNGSGLAWTRSLDRTNESKAVVFDNCIATAVTPSGGRAFADGDNGCIIHVKNSKLTNYTVVVHGPDSGGPTNSSYFLSFHNNTAYSDDTINGLVCQVYIRGGTGLIYSNTVSSSGLVYNGMWRLTLDCAATGIWASEGCSRQLLYPADYPAYQQPGTPYPIYAWSNSIPSTVFGEWNAGNDSGDAPFLVAGREYTNAVPDLSGIVSSGGTRGIPLRGIRLHP